MEGRRNKRRQIRIGCWILDDEGVSHCCSSFDISDTGISVCFNAPMSVGRKVTLQLYTHTSAAPLTLPAEVVWSSTDSGGAMGLRFLNISAKELDMLREISRLVMIRERER